jgi:regulator of RNase E activity RraA
MNGRKDELAQSVKFAGSALTLEVSPGDNLTIHAALAIAKPGDVIVVDGGGCLRSRIESRNRAAWRR